MSGDGIGVLRIGVEKLQIYAESNYGNSLQVNEDQIFCDGHYRKELQKTDDQYQAVLAAKSLDVFAVLTEWEGCSTERGHPICASRCWMLI